MEDESLPVHDLLSSDGSGSDGLGSDDRPTAGPEELRRIVTRAARRRWRTGALALALTLVLGGVGGYFISDAHQAQPIAASGSNRPGGSKLSTTAPQGSSASAASSAGGAPVPGSAGVTAIAGLAPLRHLFTRSADGLTIRAFVMTYNPRPASAPASKPGCPAFPVPTGFLTAELSTDRMVATLGQGQQGSLIGPVGPAEVQVVGQREGDPRLVVVAQVAAQVTEVSATFSGGSSDRMVPVGGWVALSGGAIPTSVSGAHLGTMTVTGTGGRVLATEPIALGYPGPFGAAGAAGAAGTAGTGSAVIPPSCQAYAFGGGLPVPMTLPTTTAPAEGVPSTTASGGTVPGSTVPGTAAPATTVIVPPVGPAHTIPAPGPAPASPSGGAANGG